MPGPTCPECGCDAPSEALRRAGAKPVWHIIVLLWLGAIPASIAAGLALDVRGPVGVKVLALALAALLLCGAWCVFTRRERLALAEVDVYGQIESLAIWIAPIMWIMMCAGFKR